MKKYLIIALMLLIVTATKAQQIEGTQITSPIVPNDVLDNYPTHIDSLGFGGYRVVVDTNQRNAIKSTRKTKGMLVYALSDSTLYKLENVGSNKWSVLTTRLSDIDTIPNNLVVKGGLDVIGNPPFNYPEILLNVKDSAENQRMLVSKNGLFLAGRLHTGPIDVDGLYMLGAKNYLGGMNSSASGYNAYNNSDTTQAFGNYLHTGDKNNSILIGTGKSEAEPLLLDRHNSIQIGANSTTPNIIIVEDTTIIEDLLIINDTVKINVLGIGDSTAHFMFSGDSIMTKKKADELYGGSISGDVTKVGTPVDNQLGVWTGNGTIEGTSKLSWNGKTLSINDNSSYANVVIGDGAGAAFTTGSGNTVLGNGAFQANTGGGSNTVIGRHAGYNATGAGNVFLGNSAGRDETGSNKLYIMNNNSYQPLIWGDFSTRVVKIFSRLQIESSTAVTGVLVISTMTTTVRDEMTATNGMIIYNTSTNVFNFYENGSWVTK